MTRIRGLAQPVLASLVVASLVLTLVSAIAVPPAFAGAGDYCITTSTCGWCHSRWCPNGYGVLYYGNLKKCYNASGRLISTSAWCDWSPCGVGQCN